MPTFQNATDRFLSFLKTDPVLASPSTRLVYRTVTHGHPNCSLYTTPITPAGRPWPSFPGHFSTRFRWNLHPQFNNYTLSRQQEEGLLGDGQKDGDEAKEVLVLRADALLMSRPDGHYQGPKEDCLHYKMPGPSDWTNVLLFNLWDAEYARAQEVRLREEV